MKKMHCLFTTITVLALGVAQAQTQPSPGQPSRPMMRPPGEGEMAQGMRRPSQPGGPAIVKPYDEVITSRAKTEKGFFTVHKVEDRYYFEIPDSLLGRDVLVVNRIARAAADSRSQMLGYAGDEIGEGVIRFEKGPGNRVFLKTVSYQEVSNDSSASGMYRSVRNSNLQPIVAAFDIKAFGKDKACVIDLTDFLSSDNDIIYFDASVKKTLSLAMQMNDRCYTEELKAFPANIEIRVVKTYARTPVMSMGGAQAPGPQGPATYELNSSMVLLPAKPMEGRYFDPRVGYFATGYTDFDANPQGVKKIYMVTRWRLEPRPEDVEKYKRGELVEPRKPIVFYIDPATPKKWVPYLIQGVNDWNVAFEKAGWKNAIVAREAPVNDSAWSIDDASHSAIVYKPSVVPNASGPNVHDPRSGEILEAHINWYHNVMSLVHNWYFVQTAAVDPKARTMHFDDSLMGELIRFVSSHEVGHTLGLRHNFGSSSTVPVENLRNKKWVEENGHTPSIMDYARFNYVAQPEDSISEKGLFPRIGDYDKWAIEWGYRWYPDGLTPDSEKVILNKLTAERLGKNKRLFFGTETDINDPREQNEDLGDNAMKAGAYGIKNLQRILPHLLEWTREPGEGYENAKMMYNEVIGQWVRYLGHVVKNIGGITTTYKMVEDPGPVVEFVPKARQQEAMAFLQQQLFTTPKWLLDKKLFDVTGEDGANVLASIQGRELSQLLNPMTMAKLVEFEVHDPAGAYTLSMMLGELRRGIFSELASGAPVDIYRRNLQKLYVERMIGLVKPEAGAGASSSAGASGQSSELGKADDALSVVKGNMKGLMAEIQKALVLEKDVATRMHLEDVYGRLKEALSEKK